MFVCYSHENAAAVFLELDALRDIGINVYYDEGISPGHEWTQELADAIDRCSRFLYFVSPAAVASRHCRNEVQYALDQDKPVVSVYLEPTELTGGLRLALGSAQAILKHELSDEMYRHKVSRAVGLSAPLRETPRHAGLADHDSSGEGAQPRGLRRWVSAVALMLIAVVFLAVWAMNRSSPQAPETDRSIAVLPLSVVGDDPRMAAIADALTEEMRTVVSGYRELSVVSADSAREAEWVSYLLEGNLQRLGDRIRLRTRLLRADDGVTVWSRSLDQLHASALAEPSKLATMAARFVRLQLVQDQQCESVRRATISPDAGSEYCMALREFYRWMQVGSADMQLLRSHAQRAIDLDPEIVDAYYLLGYFYLEQPDWREAVASASTALERGKALAPDDPMMLALQANLEWVKLDYTRAKASLEASLALAPTHPLAGVWYVQLSRVSLAQGHLDDALVQLRRALRIDDTNAVARAYYAYVLLLAGENGEAIRVAEEGLQLVETGMPYASLTGAKVMAQHAMGEIAQANATLDQALSSVDPLSRVLLAPQLALLGREQEARSVLAQLESFGDPPAQLMVSTYAYLNDERAFDWILEGIERHDIQVIMWLRIPFDSAPATHDPRWDEMVKRLEAEVASARIDDGR